MIPLLFAVAVLAQTPPVAQEGPPARLQFHAPVPASLPDPGPWPGDDIGFEELEVEPSSPAASYLQKRGACKAEAPCILEGRFEHNMSADSGEHVDRYILIGPSGRLEGYAYQLNREAKPRLFVLTGTSAWQEIKPENEEYASQSLLYAGLSHLLSQQK